jgi:hypothetical protein
LQAQKEEQDYFKTRANTVSLLNQRLQKPKLNATNDLFNRLFGTGKVDIRPSGNVDITMGYQGKISKTQLCRKERVKMAASILTSVQT